MAPTAGRRDSDLPRVTFANRCSVSRSLASNDSSSETPEETLAFLSRTVSPLLFLMADLVAAAHTCVRLSRIVCRCCLGRTCCLGLPRSFVLLGCKGAGVCLRGCCGLRCTYLVGLLRSRRWPLSLGFTALSECCDLVKRGCCNLKIFNFDLVAMY